MISRLVNLAHPDTRILCHCQLTSTLGILYTVNTQTRRHRQRETDFSTLKVRTGVTNYTILTELFETELRNTILTELFELLEIIVTELRTSMLTELFELLRAKT
jgi:hypothetical protein